LKYTESAISHFRTTKASYLADPDATSFLGVASSRIYKFIHVDLAVPFFGEKFIREAEWEIPKLESEETTANFDKKKVGYQSMGGMIATV
jgi:phenylalanine ammonia-lyase